MKKRIKKAGDEGKVSFNQKQTQFPTTPSKLTIVTDSAPSQFRFIY